MSLERDLLIGVDAGTSVLKAVVFDLQGRQVSTTSRPNSYQSLDNGGAEQDMQRTWTDMTAVLRDLCDRQPDLARRVLALSITGQGDGTWLIDRDGEPVHDGWLWLDARAAETARQLGNIAGIDTIYRTTGTGVNISQMRTHLTWMREHSPELLARAATAFHCKDWLYFKLTGMRATDPTEGVFTFGDYRTRHYSDAVIDALDLGDMRHLLPPIIDGIAHADPLTADAANATGLPQGLPVTLGYVDVMCGAIGAGLFDAEAEPGLSILGSTGMHMRFVRDADAVTLNEDRCGYTMAFPGTALAQMQTNMAATLNIDWMLDLAREVLASADVERSRGQLLQGMDERVLDARPGAAIFHPYISAAGERGPFAEPDARASFSGLHQGAGWFDLMRAVYDGLALASRHCYTAMGPIPSEIRLSGGAARSRALRKILAASLNAPIRTIAQPESGAAGAVMLAAVQQGVYADLEACVDTWVKPLLQPPEQPDPALCATYDDLFVAYEATQKAMPQAWAAQAAMRRALA